MFLINDTSVMVSVGYNILILNVTTQRTRLTIKQFGAIAHCTLDHHDEESSPDLLQRRERTNNDESMKEVGWTRATGMDSSYLSPLSPLRIF